MKTNLVYTLYWVQKSRLLPMEQFEDMLRPSERNHCNAQPWKKTWYSMAIKVFTTFVFRVRSVVVQRFYISIISIYHGILLTLVSSKCLVIEMLLDFCSKR